MARTSRRGMVRPYGLTVLASTDSHAEHIFVLTVVTVAISIIAHSSSDILIARWLERHPMP
jgi:sodium/hydrogen antiporter